MSKINQWNDRLDIYFEFKYVLLNYSSKYNPNILLAHFVYFKYNINYTLQ